jgi:hypothetical protein
MKPFLACLMVVCLGLHALAHAEYDDDGRAARDARRKARLKEVAAPQKVTGVLSVLGSVGGRAQDHKGYDFYTGFQDSSSTFQDLGLQASLEWRWVGLGLGVNFEKHLDRLYDQGNGPTGFSGLSVPLFVEFFAPFRYVRPGVQLGPYYFSYEESYSRAQSDHWGMGVQATPVLKIVPIESFAFFLTARYTQPVFMWEWLIGSSPEYTIGARWTYGAGISWRI